MGYHWVINWLVLDYWWSMSNYWWPNILCPIGFNTYRWHINDSSVLLIDSLIHWLPINYSCEFCTYKYFMIFWHFSSLQMTFWSQSECLHEWFTTIIVINNNREGGIKHCTWKGERNWIHRIQDSWVIYYNEKAIIDGKDGMNVFSVYVLIVSMTSQSHQWLISAINDYRKRDIGSGLIGLIDQFI